MPLSSVANLEAQRYFQSFYLRTVCWLHAQTIKIFGKNLGKYWRFNLKFTGRLFEMNKWIPQISNKCCPKPMEQFSGIARLGGDLDVR